MANRYWVQAGGGIWDATNTAYWSETQNGPPGASAPTSQDNVFFNTYYGSASVTIGFGAVCASVTRGVLYTFLFNGNFLTVGNQKVTVLTTGASFTTPPDWNNNANAIYLIGGGGGGAGGNRISSTRVGGAGGGGGGYTVLTNQTLSGNIPYTIGLGGTAGAAGTGAIRVAGTGGTTTWNTTNTATGGTGGSALATGVPASTAGVGGTGTYTGGTGGVGSINTTTWAAGGGGGGGSAGPNGNGGNGGNGVSAQTTTYVAGGGGGGNGGGTAGGNATTDGLTEVLSGAGGNNSLGFGGGAAIDFQSYGNTGFNGGGGSGGVAAGGGGTGGSGNEILGVTGSSGGQGGSGSTSNSYSSNLIFGGGGGGGGTNTTAVSYVGGAGRQGAIIIVYTPPSYAVGGDDVANYVNTTSGQVINVTANKGLGDLGVVTRASLTGNIDLSFVIASNMANVVIDVTSVPNYIAGKSSITITVNTGVYVYGVTPIGFSGQDNQVPLPYAALEIVGGSAGDTIKLVNNGYITGYGGDGSGLNSFENFCCAGYYATTTAPTYGGPALSLVTPGITFVIQNNGFIAGGGGGGGSAIHDGTFTGYPESGAFGGGGAGGGITYNGPGFTYYNMPRATPTAPTGFTGNIIFLGYDCVSVQFYEGGGGGFILPGVGGAFGSIIGPAVGIGGGAGGSGAANIWANGPIVPTNEGGSGASSAGDTAENAYDGQYIAGGGGGWGGSGGNGVYNGSTAVVGASGGNSVITNGNAVVAMGNGPYWGVLNTTQRSFVYTIPATAANVVLDFNSIPGFSASNYAQVVVIVPSNVTLYSNNNSAALTIGVSTVGARNCNVRLIVNGIIQGRGGPGGSSATNLPQSGGRALQLGNDTLSNVFDTIIDVSNGYIAGGGGGGGYAANASSPGLATRIVYGGGGAGGGNSGFVTNEAYVAGPTTINTLGTDGRTVVNGAVTYTSGGTGGTIVPGDFTYNTGTFAPTQSYPGKGGQAGGSGPFYTTNFTTESANAGGAFRFPGETENNLAAAGGGGGGWGADGGAGYRNASIYQSGASGGYGVLISLNQPGGYVSVYPNFDRIAGSVGYGY